MRKKYTGYKNCHHNLTFIVRNVFIPIMHSIIRTRRLSNCQLLFIFTKYIFILEKKKERTSRVNESSS